MHAVADGQESGDAVELAVDVDAKLAPPDVGEMYRNRPGQNDGGRGLGQGSAPGSRAVTSGLVHALLSPGDQSNPRARVPSRNDLGDLDAAGPDEGLHALGGAAGEGVGLLAGCLP